MLVVDASVAVVASLAVDGFAQLGDEELVAPPLMFSEARSALHELVWRREVTAEDGQIARRQLERAKIKKQDHRQLGAEAWRIADELGWAKTYDAEYVALAVLLECSLVTLDSRLLRSADRLGVVVSAIDL